MAPNVLQIDVGGLSKLPVSIPTKGYLKILTLLVSRKKKFPKGAAVLRANDDRDRPLTFICCYAVVF